MRRADPESRPVDLLVRAGVLAGAATAVAFAARRRTAAAWSGAAAVALPLAARGVTGRWPLGRPLESALPVAVRAHLSIARRPAEVYDAWRRLEDLPQVLRHVLSVEPLDDGHWRWRARTLAGTVEWQAAIEEERPGERLRWRSLPGSEIQHEGTLELRPGRAGEGTSLDLDLRIGAAGPRARAAVAALLRPALALEIREDLRRFKNRLEAGEVPTTEGQPAGERSRFAPRNVF
jgi:uncharacterized membrane protein